ncbi:hypothetical protein ACFSKU_14585 [Pontibacter silvestris]|uniref:Uncharacterized protein n=1 Tax=Pontibacter silvestris TaxID=2305183 RepID=A0ABW4WZE1_9BACT|nr:hypothetical protein [Pontibacter silvestris]MCC9138719.1 hypothetical protein [Pontibacter silvestris]
MEISDEGLPVVDVQVDSLGTTPFRMSTPEEQQASYERYYSRVFSVKDAFITAKRFHDWLRSGLLPLDIPEGRKNLMNLPEFIWVRLIGRLRQVGTPLEQIQALKEYLFAEIDVQALAAEAMQSAENQAWVGKMLDRSGISEEQRQAIQDEMASDAPFASVQGKQKYTVLDSVLFHLLASRDEAGVQLLPEGYFVLWMESSGEPRLKTTHVYLSITEQVDIFRTSGIWEKKAEKLDELTPEEWQVVWAIRDRRAKEVTVNFTEKGERRRLDITTTTGEVLDLNNLNEEAIQRIIQGKFTDVSMKTQDGKTLYIERKKRRRV